jgi:hypothetical protein
METATTLGSKATSIVAAGLTLTFLTGAGLLLRGGEPAPPPEIPDLRDEIAAVTRVAGGPPDRCFVAAPDRQVCRWHVQGRLMSGKRPTRPGGEAGLYLVCELRRGEAEAPACVAHALDAVGARLQEPTGLPPVSAASGSDPLEGRRTRARIELSVARTLPELSHLVGDVPDRCRTGLGIQHCEWQLRPGSAGHERLAGLAATDAALALRCALPLDGAPREIDDCSLGAAEPSDS